MKRKIKRIVIKQYLSEYLPDSDKTVIWELRFDGSNGDLLTESLVGWYFGTPNNDDTKFYIGNLTATWEA